MSLSAWNYQGIGNCCAVDELGDIIRAQDPGIVFLSETWLTKVQTQRICDNLDFDGCFTVSSDGKGGRLALLWKASENV